MSADDERFERAVGRIDDANAADPSVLVARGKTEPKELVHSRMLTEWVRRLRPDASEALLLAARAHHIRRWVVPRESYPKGRRGYLQWRTRLHGFHAEQVAQILRGVGYPDETVARVGQIIRKQRLRTDPEVQTLEDGLALVFLETQLEEFATNLDDEEKLLNALRRTWEKMTPAGHEAALRLPLGERAQAIVRRAIAGEEAGEPGSESSAAAEDCVRR